MPILPDPSSSICFKLFVFDRMLCKKKYLKKQLHKKNITMNAIP